VTRFIVCRSTTGRAHWRRVVDRRAVRVYARRRAEQLRRVLMAALEKKNRESAMKRLGWKETQKDFIACARQFWEKISRR
jgi:hypothetical protein